MQTVREQLLEAKLEAVEAMAEKLPPLDWKPYDDAWGDYNAYPCADGHYSEVDDSNSGDVHSHGIACGEWSIRKEIDRILKGGE